LTSSAPCGPNQRHLIVLNAPLSALTRRSGRRSPRRWSWRSSAHWRASRPSMQAASGWKGIALASVTILRGPSPMMCRVEGRTGGLPL
jgi:hypothetical protein